VHTHVVLLVLTAAVYSRPRDVHLLTVTALHCVYMYAYCYYYCCCYCSAGIAALGKIFVGQLVETAVTIREERGEAYPGSSTT
jgi:hTAFII28-like protein conserved region